MASKTKSTYNLFILVALLATLSSSFMTDARSFSNPNLSRSSLVVRLKLEDEDQFPNCWDSLFQLQACTGEVIMFFLNDEIYLGHACCQAIRVIEKDCWPNVIGSLGFTTQESDTIQGYCDHEVVHSPLSPPRSIWDLRWEAIVSVETITAYMEDESIGRPPGIHSFKTIKDDILICDCSCKQTEGSGRET